MHYLFILAILVVVTFATGGHSSTFGQAYQAAARGEVVEAVDLFSTALRRTLQDAEAAQRKVDPADVNLAAVPPLPVKRPL